MLEVDIFFIDKMSAMHDRLTLLPNNSVTKITFHKQLQWLQLQYVIIITFKLLLQATEKDNEGRGSPTLLTRQATVQYMPVMVLTILGL